jgi:hypothetical protein
MKWVDRNILFIVFGFLAACILFQMWYIWEIKSELKLFHSKEHIVIEVIELKGQKYTDTIKINCDSSVNRMVTKKMSMSKF